MLYLKEFNKEDIAKEYELLKKLPSENGFDNPYLHISFEDFFDKAYIDRVNSSKGINLLPNYVPDTYFFLWDDDVIVGLFKVRHCLNKYLEAGAGHMGYSIAPEYRGKGYATKGLGLAIKALANIPDFKDKEIYLSCNINNTPSLMVMLKNGAYIHHSTDKLIFTRINVKNVLEDNIKRYDVDEELKLSNVVIFDKLVFVGECSSKGKTALEQIDGSFNILKERLAKLGLDFNRVIKLECKFKNIEDSNLLPNIIKKYFDFNYPLRSIATSSFLDENTLFSVEAICSK